MTNQVADLLRLAGEFALFLQESAEYQQDASVAKTFVSARQIASGQCRRLELAQRHDVFALVGLTNVGKSTLLNSLFDADVAPRRNGPCTAVPIEFVSAEAISLAIEYREGFGRQHLHCRDFAELRKELDALAGGLGDLATGAIYRLTVGLPNPLLDGGVTLADTPGFGAAQPGDDEHGHERALHDYLKCDVAQVFWIVSGPATIGSRERHFYDQFLAGICDDVVVTGCEEWDHHDKERFQRRFAPLFYPWKPAFHFVSSPDQTGIPELRHCIRELATPQGRFAAVRRTLLQLAEDIGSWARNYRDPRGRRLNHPWSPVSRLSFRVAPECNGLRTKMVEALG